MRFLRKLIPLFLCIALFLTGCGLNSVPSTTGPIVIPTYQTERPDIEPSDTTAGTQATYQPDSTQSTEPTDGITPTKPAEPTTPTIPSNSTFEVHYIDVGQADAALILCDGKAALIDGGNASDSSLIYTYLKKHGIAHLDYVIGTHAHEDHIGGLAGALNAATVGTALCSVKTYDSKAFSNFVKAVGKHDKSITVPKVGYSFNIGSANAVVLGPVMTSTEPNNMSLVIRIDYGQTSFLFTGDAEYEEETDILDAGYDIDCTVLKVGHHGSDTSTSYRWLREVTPDYAVISVGKGNSYGHPTENLLSRLRDADVTTFRTDMQGDIICTSDGITVRFEVDRNADADTLTDAGDGGSHVDEPTTPTVPDIPQTTPGRKYILNTNTKKFHYPSCSSAKRIAAKNKKEVICTRDELIEDGYDPCGHCDP